MKIKMEFELEDLINVKLLIRRDDEYITAEIEEIRKGLVCISPDPNSMEDYWIPENELEIKDILFR